jgi:hypothetical protein
MNSSPSIDFDEVHRLTICADDVSPGNLAAAVDTSIEVVRDVVNQRPAPRDLAKDTRRASEGPRFWR